MWSGLSVSVAVLEKYEKHCITKNLLCISFYFILGHSDPGVDTSDSRDGPNLPFTLLKKADVELHISFFFPPTNNSTSAFLSTVNGKLGPSRLSLVSDSKLVLDQPEITQNYRS